MEQPNQYRILRGGYYTSSSPENSACYRGGTGPATSTSFAVGFRVVLYIK